MAWKPLTKLTLDVLVSFNFPLSMWEVSIEPKYTNSFELNLFDSNMKPAAIQMFLSHFDYFHFVRVLIKLGLIGVPSSFM